MSQPLISWERRYEDDGSEFDWYIPAADVVKMIEPLIPRSEDEILYVGCGTSSLGKELYDRGRRFVTNVDTSRLAVHAMAQRYADLNDMQFVEMDATRLPKDLGGAFQLVVDKALLDYFLCEVKKDKANKFLKEMKRVLKIGGWFCCVSHGTPETRLPQLASAFEVPSARIKVTTVPKPDVPGMEQGASPNYFVYMVRVEA